MNRWRTRFHTLAVCLLVPLMSACQERSAGSAGSIWRAPQAEPNAALQALVEGPSLSDVVDAPQMTTGERARLVDQVRRLYKAQNYQLIWFDGDKPSKRYGHLRDTLDAAGAHGLPAELYTPPIVARASEASIPPDSIPQFDAAATAAFFRYSLHLTGGRLDPRALQSLWTLKPKRPDLAAALTDAVTHNNLADAMHRLQPSHPEYRELMKALHRYRSIAAKGGWPSLPPATRLEPGQQSDVVPILRRRLAIEGDLNASLETDASPFLDERVVDALERFEQRHRLEPDGILDRTTVAALNVPVQRRIRTIELNMERWRWLPDPMPRRYLVVNVPDFRLEAMENNATVMSMRVVVGEPDNKTPIFADEMTHVVFSPYWNVPPNIAQEETIPSMLSDPGFMARNNMEVVTASGEVVDPHSIDWSSAAGLRIRQRPGSGNALGGVKFMFPNNFDVYLHDTNATKLFDRLERGLSHGCVRVEEPHKLALYVLRDQPEWTPEAVAEAMKSGQEKHVKVQTRIPVYIIYKTAWVHDGGVRFLKDLYGHDAHHIAKLWP